MQSTLQNFQTVLESIEEGVFTIDMNWKIMFFNRAAEQITGFKRQEVIGKPCRQIFRTNVCDNECAMRRTLQESTPFSNVPICIKRADNKEIHISVNTSVLKDSNQQKVGGVEIFRDLTALSRLRKVFYKQHNFDDIISKNYKLLKYFEILPKIAESDSTVLIEGSTGTGKELFARAIHNHSKRMKGPFIAINCSAMPDTLIESELFGYKSGAFTDAKKDKPGCFALAENGTLFLDEIGDISSAIQVRLLRVLQEKSYEPLGSTESIHTNARVIAATNLNLEELVKEKRFRDDLFYRINIIRIKLPPLKERREDIPYLVDHFIDHFNYSTNKKIHGFTDEVMSAFMLSEWPGNVRELENTIEYAFVLCKNGVIGLEHLPERIVPDANEFILPPGLTLREAEKLIIEKALKRNKWKKVKTADELGIDKNTLRRKIIRLGIKQSSKPKKKK